MHWVEFMRKILVVVILVALLSAGCTGVVLAQQTTADNRDIVWHVLNGIDSSIHAVRKGDTTGAQSILSTAGTLYFDNISLGVQNVDNALDNKITQSFNSVYNSPSEDGLRTLRADVSLAASKIGASVSPVYSQAIFVILAIAIVFSLIITLITKRVVDWPKVKAARKEMDDWRKQMMDAQRKKDMKRLYKLQQDQKRIMGLQGQVMMSSFKPAIFYIVPYFILWIYLSGLYKSWVVAWLPFNLPLPYFGTMISLGFLSWFLISYFGFSQVWRKLLIGD
jgi:uncharacterized membrane protein (DUF106 family)